MPPSLLVLLLSLLTSDDLTVHVGAYVAPTNTDWRIHNCRFESNAGAWIAGGLYFEGIQNLQISDTVFSSNHASIGGAVYFKDCEQVVCSNVVFAANGANLQLGGVGGAVSMLTSQNITLVNSMFDGNVAWAGAAMHSSRSRQVFLLDSHLRSNVALDAGGAVLLLETVFATIFNSSLVDNVGSLGGGVALSGSKNVSIERSLFRANSASSLSGSAIFVTGSSLSLTGSSFLENTALQGKWCIFVQIKRSR